MSGSISRRTWLKVPVAAAGLGWLAHPVAAEEAAPAGASFRYCLNTSTIRGRNLTLAKKVEIAAQAGYSGIEPWIREIQEHVEAGGTLAELRQRIADAGLQVENAIGFAQWIVDDPQQRARGLDDLKRDMDLVRQIGGSRIAAPPSGATEQEGLDLFRAAERYRAALEAGRQTGVVPQLELWGFSRSLSRLGEIALVASEAAHPDACLLPDVYHIYKGGSDFQGLHILSGRSIHVFHMNDYPDRPPRSEIQDRDRVYPGKGIAPLGQILRLLHQNGFQGALSLELFNPQYWEQDPLEVARTGLGQMRLAVRQALADSAAS